MFLRKVLIKKCKFLMILWVQGLCARAHRRKTRLTVYPARSVIPAETWLTVYRRRPVKIEWFWGCVGKSSTSHSGGNQVDGLPPASSRVILGRERTSFKLVFFLEVAFFSQRKLKMNFDSDFWKPQVSRITKHFYLKFFTKVMI